jgi:PAS domain S-box-containing protein
VHNQTVIDLIPALAWAAGPDGSVGYFNQGWLEYTGLSPDEALRWGWTVALHPDDLSSFVTYWKSLITTGSQGEIEARLRRSDGEYRWFLFRAKPVRDQSGTVVQWYGTNTDIEDRRRTEEALRESERELRELVEAIPAQVWRGTADGKLDYLNQRLADYLGHTAVELSLGAWMDLIHPDHREQTVRRWVYSAATGAPYRDVYRIRRSDGQYRWIESSGVPFRDKDSHIVRWYGMLVDIEDHKRAEEALRSSERKLSAAIRIATVAELSASIAHELNQPLAAVLANSEACRTWLSSMPPNVERARLTAERITRDAKTAAEIVHRTRALFEQAPPAKAPLNLNDVISEVLDVLGDELRHRSITRRTNLDPMLPRVSADRVQLQQLALNLVQNAMEAMDSASEARKVLEITSQRSTHDAVSVDVIDHGPGITDPNTIFDPFVTTKANGMGMGLTICRSIIEAHGGRISARSNEHGGTTFTFTIPVQEDATP